MWDLPTRLFHWTLVVGVVTAYLSAKYRLGELHKLTGYALCFLVLFRVSWGMVGSQYSCFKSFIFSRQETVTYLRSMLTGNPKHYFGHNPAGALMVFTLLGLLAAIFITGLLTLALIDFDGPLVRLVAACSDAFSYRVRHLHGLLINGGMILVALHLLGVIGGSIQHKENLVKAMFTGNKAPQPNPQTQQTPR